MNNKIMATKVFCTIDDQERSGWAADTAIDLARATSSMLIFFMANPAVLPGRGPVVYLWANDYIDKYFVQAKGRARRANVYDVKCITKNAVDVAKAILREAENEGADYIVMGSNGQAGLFGFWKNSITRQVAAKTHCPTIIVHNELPRRHFGPGLLAAE
jgi:nucleotide-binding universal stress UspA family protein